MVKQIEKQYSITLWLNWLLDFWGEQYDMHSEAYLWVDRIWFSKIMNAWRYTVYKNRTRHETATYHYYIFRRRKFFFIQHLSWRLKRRSLRRSSSSFFIWSCSVADFDYFWDCEHLESAERFRAARCQSSTYSKLLFRIVSVLCLAAIATRPGTVFS